MKNRLHLLSVSLILALFSFLFVGVAHALAPSNTNLLGTWENVDPNTRGIIRIIIANNGAGGITVHPFGACHPNPCDIGQVRALVYSNSVGDGVGMHFTANIKSDFAKTILTGTVRNSPRGPRLRVNSYTKFTDGSNRYNYSSTASFQK